VVTADSKRQVGGYATFEVGKDKAASLAVVLLHLISLFTSYPRIEHNKMTVTHKTLRIGVDVGGTNTSVLHRRQQKRLG
jgi:hypothetical protein